MCGICGELRFDSQQPTQQGLEKMMAKLERRGPDFGNHYINGSMGLGHQRLAIIDLSERANQPMVDDELGLALVFNGTIYNYPELRAELIEKGYHFFSDGDSEVIIKSYAEWGKECVKRFSGMFAFVIWDQKQKQLFMARDRMGIKPFYYSHDTNRFIFGSNLQAVLAAGGVDTDIDPVGLHHQFTLHAVIPAPHTILKGVRKLNPAHTMTISENGESQLERYWTLTATRPEESKTEEEWTESIHQALQKSVKRRLDIADVPVGVLLSGGLDSSLLVGLLAEQGVKDIRTFSIGFEDQPEESGSEFEFSDQVVAMYNTRHQKIVIPNDQVLKRLPEAIGQMAEPMVGQDAVAFYLLSEQVAKDVKVVQSGQGADEVFAGYFWYPQMAAATGTDVERFGNHYFDRDHAEFLETVTEKY
ncbi:MAG: N-acetylglutaminylglutamine amidotransferase, partial [Chromatiales bacterium]|nr:N-acetylglutaminylglutamine amidotransferase [Chromatiales bacterium]